MAMPIVNTERFMVDAAVEFDLWLEAHEEKLRKQFHHVLKDLKASQWFWKVPGSKMQPQIENFITRIEAQIEQTNARLTEMDFRCYTMRNDVILSDPIFRAIAKEDYQMFQHIRYWRWKLKKQVGGYGKMLKLADKEEKEKEALNEEEKRLRAHIQTLEWALMNINVLQQ